MPPQNLKKLCAGALAASLASAVQALHTDAVSSDDAYLQKLHTTAQLARAKPAHAPVEAAQSVGTELGARAPVGTGPRAPPAASRPARPVVDVAAINAAVTATYGKGCSRARGAGAPSVADAAVEGATAVDKGGASAGAEEAGAPRGAADSRYLQSLERSIVQQKPGVKFAPSALAVEIVDGADAAFVHREVAFVAITRGCHPAVAAAVRGAVEAAAANDRLGFTYYLVTDATPDAIVSHLEKALHAEIPDTYEEIASGDSPDAAAYLHVSAAGALAGLESPADGAVPILAVFDRSGSSQVKFIMPPSMHSGDGEEEGAGGGAALPAPLTPASTAASVLPPMVHLLLASSPYPSEIAEFTAAFARGELRPTLLGAPRPAGDAYPGHGPYLTQVVSESWDGVVLDEERDVLLEAYLTHCPMCMCIGPRLRMLAYLLHHYGPRVQAGGGGGAGATSSSPPPPTHPLVRVAVMNVDDNERPVEWMPGPAFPTIQLFARGGEASRPWTKAHGPGCGPAATHALATLEGYGVALPHGHLAPNPEQFESTSGGEGGAHSGVPPHTHVRPGVGGPVTAREQRHEAVLAVIKGLYNTGGKASGGSTGPTTSVPAPLSEAQRHPAAGKLSGRGTPACVPSLDFRHPTQPGKSALPTVTDLLYWVAAHCSAPFDPATLRVPAAEFRGSRARMVEMGMLPPPPTSSGGGAALDSVPTPDGHGTVPLLAVAADMDAESRAYESAVFDSFYYQSMAKAYTKACSGAGAGEGGGEEGESGGVPPSYSTPLSSYTSPEARAQIHMFNALLKQLQTVGIDGAMYGRLEETVSALDNLAAYAEEHGIRDGARAWLLDQEEGKKVAQAVKAAAQLVRPRTMQ